jgi:uncharacterized protein YbaR (Trm112 family)
LKPWLLNILACPIDKHHPLEVYFFSFETPKEEIERITSEAGSPSKDLDEKYKLLQKQLGDGTISHVSMEVITDRSGVNEIEQLRLKVVGILQKKGQKTDAELDILYKFMHLLEIREGLLFCTECTRWYPIGNSVETIPELMPDDLREKENEIKWLKKWSHLVPEKAKKGKPFNL